jgi:hypothetical protein
MFAAYYMVLAYPIQGWEGLLQFAVDTFSNMFFMFSFYR